MKYNTGSFLRKARISKGARRTAVVFAAFICCFIFAAGAGAATVTEAEFKARVEAVTKDLKDLGVTATVAQLDKTALEKIEPNYARLLELKTARVLFKFPDKMKIEGKLGMVKFEYIINAGIKLSRAPMVRFKRKDDYSKQPGKLQGPFDMGIITPSLWKDRAVRIVESPEAADAGEMKLDLRWKTGDSVYYAWLDAQNLYLKRVEKWDGEKGLELVTVYSNPKNITGKVWIPTSVELFAADGSKVGKMELSDIKYNVGLQDGVFE